MVAQNSISHGGKADIMRNNQRIFAYMSNALQLSRQVLRQTSAIAANLAKRLLKSHLTYHWRSEKKETEDKQRNYI